MIDITDEESRFLLDCFAPYVGFILFVRTFEIFRSLCFDEVKVDESKN